jgi:TldD protein
LSQTDTLSLARRAILAPGGLDERSLDRTLGLVMDHAIDAADLYFQVSREESWALEDGIVKEGSASIEEGVGVRAIAGEKTGFAYSDEIQPAARPLPSSPPARACRPGSARRRIRCTCRSIPWPAWKMRPRSNG